MEGKQVKNFIIIELALNALIKEWYINRRNTVLT